MYLLAKFDTGFEALCEVNDCQLVWQIIVYILKRINWAYTRRLVETFSFIGVAISGMTRNYFGNVW